MKQFWKDFKAFISRGSIIDLAVGVVVGSAFTAIVTALTNNIITPLINWIITLVVGSDGLGSAYTILSPVYVDGVLDLSSSIYIDWGAFISAIINFLIIALVIFSILRVLTKAQSSFKKTLGELPTKAERKQLKKEGADLSTHESTVKATAELRERNKPAPAPVKKTQEDLLTEILAELKKSNATETPVVEEKENA